MKHVQVTTSDQVLAAAIAVAAARLKIDVGVTATTQTGLLLQHSGQALQVVSLNQDAGSKGVSVPVESLPLPARLGTIVDWLQRLLRRVPVLPLGPNGYYGYLQPQARCIVKPDDTPLALTEKEVDILAYLAGPTVGQTNPASRDKLLEAVWGYNPGIDTHTLETHVYRLRQKLEGAGIAALLLTGEEGYYLAQ